MNTGVYQIRHLASGRCYIGSAARSLIYRWTDHQRLLNDGTHYAVYLQNAWSKYDANAFVFEILLYCDPENCLMYEQACLDYFKPEYNTCPIAGSRLGSRHSQETRRKMSQSHTGKIKSLQHRRNLSLAHRGKRMSRDSRMKMSQARLGKYCGEDHPCAKLTERDIDTIRRRLSHGEKGVDIARDYNVTPSMVSRIKHNKVWKH